MGAAAADAEGIMPGGLVGWQDEKKPRRRTVVRLPTRAALQHEEDEILIRGAMALFFGG